MWVSSALWARGALRACIAPSSADCLRAVRSRCAGIRRAAPARSHRLDRCSLHSTTCTLEHLMHASSFSRALDLDRSCSAVLRAHGPHAHSAPTCAAGAADREPPARTLLHQPGRGRRLARPSGARRTATAVRIRDTPHRSAASPSVPATCGRVRGRTARPPSRSSSGAPRLPDYHRRTGAALPASCSRRALACRLVRAHAAAPANLRMPFRVQHRARPPNPAQPAT